MATDPMAQIRASFFVECEELLESLQDSLSALQDGSSDSETVNTVFRAVHSIKGGAGAFGLDALVAFAHRYETVLDALRAGRLEVTPDAVRSFFQAADLLQDHVRAAHDGTPAPEGAEAVLCALETLIGGPAEPEASPGFQPVPFAFEPIPLALDFDAPDDLPAPARWIIRFRPADALYASGNEPLHLLRALAALGAAEVRCDTSDVPALEALRPDAALLSWRITLPGEIAEEELREVFDFVEDVCTLEIGREAEAAGARPPAPAIVAPQAVTSVARPPAVAEAPAEPAPPPGPVERRATPRETAATVRVDLDRIDRLVNLVGELVINQAMLAQSVAEAGLPPNSAVMTGLEAFMMLTRDLQDSVMMIRAQPVKPLFQRMARIVREASTAVGKEVRLHTEGEATEVDKTVIERLAEPLTHMIRNAVDHGLETPELRLAAGKAAEGVISLSAQHRSGRIVIEVADDGAGINRPKVREIALARGLIPADAALTDAEIDALLFLPGFSTASQVSALSGRGVGMDVVRQAIQSLGGRVTIQSAPGQGTRFSISLPLTLAVLDGMVVSVADETLVVPLASILETATLAEGDIRALGPQTNVIHLRGAFVPLYDLGAELGYRAPKPSYEGGIVLLTAQEDGSRAALIVDAIHEQRQVVIKGLQQAYGRIPGVAAATILGNGRIALILDTADLVQTATGRTRIRPLALAG
ncbi:chemotaxis protein CheA [Paenirhodobacter hankyongi]|uniref:Chemotaxis protein CheA n=1 Tax=Paenirhodobacter hankyongi TaxID=2294033 RepID=A0A421BRN3_9RHOB|nr:chemotaxis protein CheA [Sinirhodobacter hankyongi]RLL70939.1 chemotaxis protein CheA [Sinirhodobacter hankyongi]